MGVVTFPTMRDAAKAATKVIYRGVPVGAVELLDDVQMKVINRVGATEREWRESPTLFFKFSGTEASVQDDIRRVREIVAQHGGRNIEIETDPTKQKSLWSARKEALWSMLSLRDGAGNGLWTTDVAVPLSKVAQLVGEFPNTRLDASCHDSHVAKRHGHVSYDFVI